MLLNRRRGIFVEDNSDVVIIKWTNRQPTNASTMAILVLESKTSPAGRIRLEPDTNNDATTHTDFDTSNKVTEETVKQQQFQPQMSVTMNESFSSIISDDSDFDELYRFREDAIVHNDCETIQSSNNCDATPPELVEEDDDDEAGFMILPTLVSSVSDITFDWNVASEGPVMKRSSKRLSYVSVLSDFLFEEQIMDIDEETSADEEEDRNDICECLQPVDADGDRVDLCYSSSRHDRDGDEDDDECESYSYYELEDEFDEITIMDNDVDEYEEITVMDDEEDNDETHPWKAPTTTMCLAGIDYCTAWAHSPGPSLDNGECQQGRIVMKPIETENFPS